MIHRVGTGWGGGGRDGLHGFEGELRETQSSLTEYKGGTVEN